MKKENFTMKELPDSEKPYEKCERDGAKSLSNAELLAVILKSGTKDKTSLALALEVLSAHPSYQGLMGLFHLTRNQLLRIHGIGPVKAVQILCAVELSKRLARESKCNATNFSRPEQLAAYFMGSVLYSDHSSTFFLVIKFQTITRAVAPIFTII